jgi:nitronate monooxygenase
MWPRTDLLELLQVEHPIIQAPMAGSTNPLLVGAVCNAGGLGSHGCAKMSAAELIDTAKQTRTITDKPFNLNFFAHSEPAETPDQDTKVLSLLASNYLEREIAGPPKHHAPAYVPFGDNILLALLEIKPAIVSFHFGLPADEVLFALREVGCKILCSATTVAEARVLAERGIDAIIAQGWEAGGHRGTFHTSFEDFGIGSMALVPQIVDAVDLPVIAAGGIADARGIAAAFNLGASGVQLGSAFLSCPEASISSVHRTAIQNAQDEDTRLTRAFSGRPARAKNNAFMERMTRQRTQFPDFPMMYKYSQPLMQSSDERGDTDYSFLLYGQAAALNCELPADQLVEKLARDALRLFPAAV